MRQAKHFYFIWSRAVYLKTVHFVCNPMHNCFGVCQDLIFLYEFQFAVNFTLEKTTSSSWVFGCKQKSFLRFIVKVTNKSVLKSNKFRFRICKTNIKGGLTGYFELCCGLRFECIQYFWKSFIHVAADYTGLATTANQVFKNFYIKIFTDTQNIKL